MTKHISPQVFQAILQTDFPSFLHMVFQTVCPGQEFIRGWHVRAIAHKLMQVHSGEITRLVINQPPRTLKSIAASVAFPAFLIGHDPTRKIICVSYSQDLATDLHNLFRKVVESDWYRALFPAVVVERASDSRITTTRGGFRVATSVRGTLTGRGADIIIIDDPLKAEEAQSDTSRKAVKDWYSNSLVTRLDTPETGAIVLVMQRLHEEDLAGHLLASGSWNHLDLPAIAQRTCRVELGNGKFRDWPEGELLDPVRLSENVVERIRREVGSFMFSAQFLQQPVPVEGNMIRRSWFQWYRESIEEQADDRIVQSWDLATSEAEASDYTVCTTWLVRKQDYYLLDVQRMRSDFPAVRKQFFELADKYKPTAILVERAGPGLIFLQSLASEEILPCCRPIGITPKGSKVERMSIHSPKIEAGQVHLPKDAPWLEAYMKELLAFPYSKHDDQVDSTSQFLKWIEGPAAMENLSLGHGLPV
jgi:predicted phage terminase large subunit-like protein